MNFANAYIQFLPLFGAATFAYSNVPAQFAGNVVSFFLIKFGTIYVIIN